MIFCIGLTNDYEAYLNMMGESAIKLGRARDGGDGYLGGSVWQTEQDALDFIKANRIPGRSVYGVVADWDSDTTATVGDSFRRLRHNAKLVRLKKSE